MCSTSPPKNSPFQTPMGQTSASPSGLFAQGTQNLFDAGNPANFPQQQATTNQPASPANPMNGPQSDMMRVKNPLLGRAGGFGGLPRGGPKFNAF